MTAPPTPKQLFCDVVGRKRLIYVEVDVLRNEQVVFLELEIWRRLGYDFSWGRKMNLYLAKQNGTPRGALGS